MLVIGVHKGVDLVLVGRRSNLMWMLPNIEISFLAIAEAGVAFGFGSWQFIDLIAVDCVLGKTRTATE